MTICCLLIHYNTVSHLLEVCSGHQTLGSRSIFKLSRELEMLFVNNWC